LPALKRVRTIQAHPPLSTCLSMDISPNERFLVIGASDASCSIWELNDLICIKTLTRLLKFYFLNLFFLNLRLDYPVRSVSFRLTNFWKFKFYHNIFSHCSNLVASGSEDRVIDVSWLLTGEK